MSPTILTQLTTQVYEYALTVVNLDDNDSQKLTAAFTNPATDQDFTTWLSGWIDTGYQLQSKPVLIRTI